MNNERLTLEDLKRIDADSYGQNYLSEAAEVLMEAAADFADLLIREEHYKIEYALRKIGMSAEQYVAVRSKNGKKWWKSGNEVENEMKEEEPKEEAEEEESEADMQKRIDREVLLPIWEKVKDGTINWQEELDNAKDNRAFAAILDYKNAIERSDYEQYSDRLKKTLAFCKDKGLTLEEVLEHFKENTHWIIRRCAKEIGYENVEVSTPEKDEDGEVDGE